MLAIERQPPSCLPFLLLVATSQEQLSNNKREKKSTTEKDLTIYPLLVIHDIFQKLFIILW